MYLTALQRKAKTLLRQLRFIQAWLLPVWLILGIGKALSANSPWLAVLLRLV